jgi:DNA replication and repair protein RecF
VGLIQLSVSSVRNLREASLKANPLFNVIFGANGSGKTSLLESIYLLGYGRSFRTHHIEKLIQHDQEKLTVFAKNGVHSHNNEIIPIGIERQRKGQCLIRIANETVKSSAELARLFPVQLIHPHSIQLIESGPKQRREYMDWALFHVEHSFYDVWKQHQKALKQRNAALKLDQTKTQVSIWNAILVETADQIDRMRVQMLSSLLPLCQSYCQPFAAIKDMSFHYYRGWSENYSYEHILNSHFYRDKQCGYTQYGPHRADLVIAINRMAANDVLSRGEKKVLVNSLMLARGALLQQLQQKASIFLIDDLPAELDIPHRRHLVEKLIALRAQTFVTGVEKRDLCDLFPVELLSMFHVEHGKIGEVGE